MTIIVPDSWDIPQQIRDRFGDTAGRQRAMLAAGHLLLVLHEPPGPDDRDRKARILWRDPAGSWAWNADGSVTHLLKKHLASFTELTEQLENQLQAASGAADYFSLLQAIAPLHRTSRNLHTTLQQAREMIPEDRDIIVARDSASDIERAFELLHEDAKNGLDYTMARRTELQSEQTYKMSVSAHRLNVLAAVFFPVTAITSIFGMNCSPALDPLTSAWIFWGVLGFGSVSGLVLSRIITQESAGDETSEPPNPERTPRDGLKQARPKIRGQKSYQ